MSFTLKKLTLVMMGLGFLISIWFNYQDYKQEQRIQNWKEYSYNQFVSGVISGGHFLGYQTSWDNKKKAALAIGEAAMALNQRAIFCKRTIGSCAPHIEEVANYLSYIALVWADPNQGDKGDGVEGEEYIKNVTVFLIKELEENGAIIDIPVEKEEKIFNELYDLIPEVEEKRKSGRTIFFYLP
ncbi:hypothetical protein [Alkalihalobacillus sp. AL-G]|uniref:hypothetical protein n=1 Tax=Alkalihalobacillus sp. AL-G TaxID=2926399 RepID=UPI00272C17FE|nr:hypothetical protein [Alkalihalobacillus sp. AL-G]WLD92849.1 hypothetical protein MOJ78_17865 [Alkalihalobacillus sp. AL-G]